MLFDTDILIWILRGNTKAAKVISEYTDRSISIVTYMELIQGAKNKQEVRMIKHFISDCNLQLISLTENIGHRASIYMEEYNLKNGMSLADALIAATATENLSRLCTGNKRHYSLINDLDIKLFTP